MGAARDFDQDENLDFSDLSDTNQSALEKAKSRWGNAEVIRGDDGYNPSDLASAENSSMATSSNSGIGDRETLAKDATTTQSSSWQNNVRGGGTHKSRNAASKGGAKNRAMSFFKGKGAFVTTGGIIGGVGALIFAGTFNMVSLMSNHITEMITEKLNSASTSMNKRSVKVMKLKVKGVNCTAGIVCRMSRVTDRNLKNLREAGFQVEVEKGKSILGRKKISSIKYVKAGHEIPLDSSSEIKSALTNNPEVREAFKRGYNGRFASFLDKKWRKLKGWFSFKKWRKNNKGKTEEEIDEDMKKTANDHSKEEDAEGKSRKGDPDPEDGKVEKGDKGTSAVKDKLKSGSSKLKKGFKNAREKSIAAANTIKGVGQTISGPLNAIDKICGVYALVTMGWSVAKVAKLEVFAQFGLSFLSMSSKIRSGDATQEEVTAQGNSLMGIANKKDSDEKKDSEQSDSNTSRLKDAFAFFADSAEEKNSPGKSATDSQGWRALAYGDRVSKLDNSAKDYQVGITGALAKIMDTFTSGTLGWVVRKGCKVATITTAVVGTAVVVASLIACATTACVAEVLGSVAWGAAVGVALSLALAVLGDKAMDEISLYVAQGLTGTILNDSTKGENFGNAIMSGSAALMSKNTMAGSGGVLTKSQAVAFYHETERQIAENAEEIRKTRSPFDPNTRHTFLGSIVSNMLPYSKQISSISGFLPSIIGGAQRSFAAITPGAHAANDANFIANMDTCEDKSIKDTGAATDIFCNVYTGIDMKIADKDTDQVIDELKSSGDLKEKDSSGDTDDILDTIEMGPELKKYEKYCFNRKKPIGASEDDDDDNFGAICNSDKNPKANMYALFLTDVRVEEGMNEEFKPDEGGGGSGSSSSSSGGVDPDLAKLSGEFVWPVKGVKVNGDTIEGVGPDQDFGPRSFFDGFSSTHYGIDFGSAKFGSAAPVYAAADGEVVYGGDPETVGWGAGSHYVAIKHNGDIYTTYSHMRSHSVHKGDKVKKGQQIGVTGAEGNASGEHLHFETKKGTGVPGQNGAFNPMDLIKGNT